jgi:hypothetical protein
LYVLGTRVDDEGLASLHRLRDLEKLGLGGDGITDRGLEALKGLSRLRELHLVGTRVTDAGVEEVRRSLPKLQVIR